MIRFVYFFLLFSVISFRCTKNTEGDEDYTPRPYYHNLDPGSSARDFLSNTVYTSLKIEIQYMPGLKPNPVTIDIFVNMLTARLNKPEGIFIELKEIDPTLKTIFSINDISGIESLNRTLFTNRDQLGAYISIIDGAYYDGNVLALAYRNTSVCIFGEPLQYFSGGVADDAKTKILAMLFMHEFGHLLGLVDMGTSMVADHKDDVNGNHCNDYSCLMHHTFEMNTRYAFTNFDDIPSLDINCINDMRANGGK